MRAIMVMFDTLTKKYLSNYGNKWVKTPNFQRLDDHCLTYDCFYGGSMPCMPARREMHTGCYNFLHRTWGPLEPFDQSAMEVLKENGVYTHLVTDHSHYWEDGGATYHNRFSSWEGFRGQEGDRWKPSKKAVTIPKQNSLTKTGISFQQNWVNRQSQQKEEDMSSVQTVMAGIEFLENYKEEDNWFLQIECFDPHEPFFCPDTYRTLYEDEYQGDYFDWPSYQKVNSTEKKADIDHLRNQYAALITMCDHYLGKILDVMDRENMWEDTMLIVNTDHGFLLGEHDWLGKNIPPLYQEIINLPFFLWDPRFGKKKEHRKELAQTIDIAPTLLDYFGVERCTDMDGKSMTPLIRDGVPIRKNGLFGTHGGHVNITDGEYVFMKSAVSQENMPLYNYTLMPTLIRGFIPKEKLEQMEVTQGGRFSHGGKVLKIPAKSYVSSFLQGDQLYHVTVDQDQSENLADQLELKEKYEKLLAQELLLAGAPQEQFMRLGLTLENQQKQL